MEKKKLTLEEMKPFLPTWLLELKKKFREEREKNSELPVKP